MKVQCIILSTYHHAAACSWAGSHLIGVGGGLLLIALVVASVLIVASLLAVLGLVASLGAGIGVLLRIATLTEGIRSRLLLLWWDVCSREGCHPASLLEDKPEVSHPQDQVDEAESLPVKEVIDTVIYSNSVFVENLSSEPRTFGTYHRGVEARDLGVINLTAANRLLITGRDKSYNLLWVSSCFHVWQAFSPSTWWHQPHEGKYCCHNKVLRMCAIYILIPRTTRV